MPIGLAKKGSPASTLDGFNCVIDAAGGILSRARRDTQPHSRNARRIAQARLFAGVMAAAGRRRIDRRHRLAACPGSACTRRREPVSEERALRGGAGMANDDVLKTRAAEPGEQLLQLVDVLGQAR